jgi:hypothetical protein
MSAETQTLNGSADTTEYAEIVEMLRHALTGQPGLILDALLAALQRAKDVLQLPPAQLYAVTTPDGEEMAIEAVDSMAALLERWRDVYKKGGQVAGFQGALLLPSKDGQYLVAPWGRFPIHAQDPTAEVDLRGRLGPVPIPRPPVVAEPGPAVVADPDVELEDPEDDEFEDEGADDDDGDDEVDDS